MKETQWDKKLLGKVVRITNGPYRNQTGIALGQHPMTQKGLRYLVGNIDRGAPTQAVAVPPWDLQIVS